MTTMTDGTRICSHEHLQAHLHGKAASFEDNNGFHVPRWLKTVNASHVATVHAETRVQVISEQQANLQKLILVCQDPVFPLQRQDHGHDFHRERC